MGNAVHSNNGTIKMNIRIIIEPRFADNIGYLAGSEEEFVFLVKNIGVVKNILSLAASKVCMQINPTKSKLMLNDNTCNPRITIQNDQMEIVNHFKYLGSVIDEKGSKKVN